MSEFERAFTRLEQIRDELEETSDVRARAKLRREQRALSRLLAAHTKHGAYDG